MLLPSWPLTETGGTSRQRSHRTIPKQYKIWGKFALLESGVILILLKLLYVDRQARHNKAMTNISAIPVLVACYLIAMILILIFSRASGKPIFWNIIDLKIQRSYFTAGEFMTQMYNWEILAPCHAILVPMLFAFVDRDFRWYIKRKISKLIPRPTGVDCA